MNRIESDIFKIITGENYKGQKCHFIGNDAVELTQLLAKKFEEGIREAWIASFKETYPGTSIDESMRDFTDYLKSIKE